SLELLDRVEGAAGQAGYRGVQSPTGNEQQRETGTGLLIMDANGALFVKGHGSSSLPKLRFIITVIYGSAEPHSPPRRGGEDAPPIRWREATESGADGVVRPARPGFRRTDHPALRATLLCEEGNSSTQFSNATLAFVRRVKQVRSAGSTAPRNRRTDRLSRCCSRPSPSACRHSRRRDNCRRFCRQESYSQTCSATPRRP